MCAVGVGSRLLIGHMVAWAAPLAGTLMPRLEPHITASRDGAQGVRFNVVGSTLTPPR